LYGCQQELIKNPENRPFLEYLCATANKLINCGIYLARQWYFKLRYITGKYDLEKNLKSNSNYQFLHAQAAQQTLRGVAESFKSYKELSYKHLAGELKHKPQLPKYRKKGGLGVITYPKQALRFPEGKVRVPLGKKLKLPLKSIVFSWIFPQILILKTFDKLGFFLVMVAFMSRGFINWKSINFNLTKVKF
jgi:transposase